MNQNVPNVSRCTAAPTAAPLSGAEAAAWEILFPDGNPAGTGYDPRDVAEVAAIIRKHVTESELERRAKSLLEDAEAYVRGYGVGSDSRKLANAQHVIRRLRGDPPDDHELARMEGEGGIPS